LLPLLTTISGVHPLMQQYCTSSMYR